jgi:sec-independent protein translocase protein TatC
MLFGDARRKRTADIPHAASNDSKHMPRHADEDLFESSKMSFGEHLEELRWALVKAVAALTIGFLIGLIPQVSGGMVDYVQRPLRAALKSHYSEAAEQEYLSYLERQQAAGMPVPEDLARAATLFGEQGLATDERLVDPQELARALAEAMPGLIDSASLPPRDPTKPLSKDDLITLRLYHSLDNDPRLAVIGLRMEEPFMVYIKAALVVGAIISSPFVFYFLWQFVAAGLYAHERHYVHIYLPFSLGLFLAGAALAFFLAIGLVLQFLLGFYQIMGIDPEPRISDWLSFVLVLPLGFGISFQLPLVMLFLERIGIFSVDTYLSRWRISVLVIAFLSMILTPSDPGSMLLMGVPLTILYFGGIWLCKLMPRRTTPFGEAID